MGLLREPLKRRIEGGNDVRDSRIIKIVDGDDNKKSNTECGRCEGGGRGGFGLGMKKFPLTRVWWPLCPD